MSLYNYQVPQWPTGRSFIPRGFAPVHNYTIYPGSLEAPLLPYSYFASPDPLAYSTTDTLAPSPSSSCTVYTPNSRESITKRSPPPLKLKRTGKSPPRRRDPAHIRRPRNAFIVFRSAFISAQKQTGTGLQHELSKQAARVWNAMSDGEKFAYQETARVEQMIHRIAHPDYQYLPTPKGTARARKPTRFALSSQAVSASALRIPALPERAEFTFSQLCMGDAEVGHANFLIDALPPSLEFGTNTLLLADTSNTAGPRSGQLDRYIQTPFPLSDPCDPATLNGVSPLALDYGLQNFDFTLHEYLSNEFILFK